MASTISTASTTDTISVGDFVKIDGKGSALIKQKICRDGAVMYLVQVCGCDFEVEIDAARIQTVTADSVSETKQTTGKSSRFLIVTDQEVNDFNIKQTNKNTLTKTISDLRIFQAFCNEPGISEHRKIQDIPVKELSLLLCRFLVSVRKRDGGDYEPSCLRGMLASFDRHLRRYDYGEYIASSPCFAKVRETLTKKQMQLKCSGKGDLPNKSDPLSDSDIETLWEKGQLGSSTPDCILQTLWFCNTVHFGLRSCQEHRDMCWGDVILKSDENGHEFLEYTERQTKTRTGANPKDNRALKPKLWANINKPERCPVNIYKIYAQRRPAGYSEPDSPFYIASTTMAFPTTYDTWFKRNPVGINKLGNMLKKMINRAGISTDKHLSNHSARKYLIQKLNDSNIPANQIMQISGHKNIQSINNYSHINQQQHKEISKILHGTENTVTSSCSQRVQVPQIRSSSDNDSTHLVNVSGGIHSLFAGPIEGGTFHVNITQQVAQCSPTFLPRKRIRIIESDSD